MLMFLLIEYAITAIIIICALAWDTMICTEMQSTHPDMHEPVTYENTETRALHACVSAY